MRDLIYIVAIICFRMFNFGFNAGNKARSLRGWLLAASTDRHRLFFAYMTFIFNIIFSLVGI